MRAPLTQRNWNNIEARYVGGNHLHRWSFGFVIPDDWMARLQAAVSVDPIAALKMG